jgi:two-component system, OmpR family, sensor histidine kinase KdpD
LGVGVILVVHCGFDTIISRRRRLVFGIRHGARQDDYQKATRTVQNILLKMAYRFAASASVVAALVFFYYRLLHVNPSTVGFTFLLIILVIAAAWGLRYAIFTALLATASLNYFFLPPVLHFTIQDPQNWVALAAFLITAVVASQLAERARREALNADFRRHEVERLYAFSQRLLATENIAELLNAVPGFIVDTFGVTAAGMFLPSRKRVYYSDLASRSLLDSERLQAVSGRGEPVIDREHGLCFVPLRMGLRPVGSVGIAGGMLSRETLEALGSMVAIAIERAGAVEKLTRTEAARESERLRSVLLDSVAHEFRTPLTAIKASAESLLSNDGLDESQRRDLLMVINEESDRLNRLVGEAGEMAQLEAHQVRLQMEPHEVREVIDQVLSEMKPALAGHPVEVILAAGLPRVRIDLQRIDEVLRHLVDNAANYTAAGTPIRISAEPDRPNGVVRISVADQGAGIDDFEQGLIFEKFYRGRSQHSVQGTGMGLPIAKAIVEAHGGTISLTSQLDHGSVFSFTLPMQPA